MKIEQQSCWITCNPKIREQLVLMGFDQVVYSLDFYNNAVLNKQIKPI